MGEKSLVQEAKQVGNSNHGCCMWQKRSVLPALYPLEIKQTWKSFWREQKKETDKLRGKKESPENDETSVGQQPFH